MSEDATPWSATEPAIHDTLRSCRSDGRVAAVATVVDVDGSAYRRPGAKMVVPEDGERLGAITAGCLEGPVAEIAAEVRSSGEPQVETFDLTDDDGWGMGLGCNGVVTILVEPVDGSFDPVLSALGRGEAVGVVTSLDASVGARSVITADGEVVTVEDRDGLPQRVVEQVRDRAVTFIDAGRAATVSVETDDGVSEVFVDGIRPAPQLLVVGNQADVNPVVALASQVGFRVTVATTRGNVDADRFPTADHVESVRAPDADAVVANPDQSYAVVMTHNFVDDRLAVEALLDTEVPYIGLMGPRDRFEEMRSEWAAEDTTYAPETLERVATPVGLDIGGGAPMEIALSIVAEVVATHHGRDGGRLADREGPIHPRVADELE